MSHSSPKLATRHPNEFFVSETAVVIRKMARWNGKPVEKDDLEERLRVLYIEEETLKTNQTQRPKFWHLFRGRNLRMKTILITMVWISNAVTYYSIAFNLENLGGNPFVTFALQAVMEAPANLLNIVLLNRVGRILPLATSMIACSICCFLYVPAHFSGEWPALILAFCAKFAICISYNIMYQLSGELYPTTLRGVGVGLSCLFGNLGTITMPYIVYSAETHLTLPMIILGIITFGGAICSAFLPETMGQHMPQTVEEAERFGLVGWNTAVVSHWKRFLKLIRARERHEPKDSNALMQRPVAA